MTILVQTTLHDRLTQLGERVATACARAGRAASEVQLVAVTKYATAQAMREAYEAGVREFGENRVQDLLAKKALLPHDIRWHMIGHLQRNKVKTLLPHVVLLHSVDSVRLAEAIDRHAGALGCQAQVLAQVNVSGEAAKQGVTPARAESLLQQMREMPNLKVKGLMTIAPHTPEEHIVRQTFRGLRTLRDRIKQQHDDWELTELSMGMTHDFEIAIEEGATIIRIGSAVFQ